MKKTLFSVLLASCLVAPISSFIAVPSTEAGESGPAAVASPPTPEELDWLPALSIDSDKVSTSGISSGAFMASQLHVAFSSQIMGAGMVAGGPFLCAGTQFTNSSYFTPMGEFSGAMKAMSTCMNPCMAWEIGSKLNPFLNPAVCEAFVPTALKPDVSASLKAAAQDPNLDDLKNLENDNVYLFTGKADFVVATDVVEAAQSFYKGVKVNSISFSDDEVDAGHAMVTQRNGYTTCPKTAVPFINTCKNIDQAEDILETIYGDLNPPVNDPYSKGKLYSFDQSRYYASKYKSGMTDTGFVYIPDDCSKAGANCGLHVALHGCLQSEDVVKTQYVTEAGYNEVAAANNLVVIYPQVESYSFFAPVNPMGCWDFWGYTGKDFYNQKGPQMSAVMKMVAGLKGEGAVAAK